MASNGNTTAGPAGNGPPPKPWERVGSASSGPSPFRPASTGSTSTVVEASGTAKPGETVTGAERNITTNANAITRPVPPRPWEQGYGNSYGSAGYGSLMNYNSGYGSNMYGGGMYGGGMYGNSMYNRGYGSAYGSSMYGGGVYGGSSFGGPMGGYGMGMSPYGNQDPNNPYGEPPSPPSFWMSFLRVMHGVVNFFGRISILIDQNTQAFHMFMSALLQLFDRSGVLYGELARFVLRLLGVRMKPRKPQQGEFPPAGQQQLLEGPKAATEAWDGVWGHDANRGN